MRSLRFFVAAVCVLSAAIGTRAQLTLDACVELAERNYPLIKKYELLEKSTALSLEEINRGWLPRIGVFAQATAQNAVSEFPSALSSMLDKAGASVAGMGWFQYKGGVELNQTIWDGGHARAQRAVQRASTEQAEAALDVELYAVRERVENLFFGILLIDEQMLKTKSTISLLESNLARMRSLVVSGIATQSDADMVEAQLLTLRQQLVDAESSSQGYRRMLELYIDESLGNRSLLRPEGVAPDEGESNRPELRLFDAGIALNNLRAKALDVSLMPRVGFFAQAYYGYPGFNIFESVMHRDPSMNAIAGIKVSWSLDGFYTRRIRRSQLAAASDMTRADRELFLFNTRLQTTRQNEKIEGLRAMVQSDARIVELRGNVRRAAESQLAHGIIDATALLAKITDENQAQLNSTLHELQLLQAIYQLKNTLNR